MGGCCKKNLYKLQWWTREQYRKDLILDKQRGALLAGLQPVDVAVVGLDGKEVDPS